VSRPRPPATFKTQPLAGDQQVPVCGYCQRAKRYCDRNEATHIQRDDPRQSLWMADVDDSRTALQDSQIARLFQHYVQNLAAWYDLSDARASFTKIVPLKALSHALLLNAVIAFAAIHLSRTHASSTLKIAERFHDNCIKRLIGLDSQDASYMDGTALAAVCLLRSYELLAEDSDPNRHLYGAYALAGRSKLDIQEASLMNACFFNYLREDITYSLIHRCPLKISLADIVQPSSARDDEDELNRASLFLADAVNTVFGRSECDDSRAIDGFQRWKSSLPTQFTPYFEADPDPVALSFPVMRMLRDCHISVLQYSLVTEMLYMSIDAEAASSIERNTIRLCGLAFTSNSPAVMVNSYGEQINA
jgi:hypothetical protein